MSPTDTAWMIIGTLVGGIILYGGIGWLLSLWLGHRSLFIGGGVVLGLAAATLLVYFKLEHETTELKQK